MSRWKRFRSEGVSYPIFGIGWYAVLCAASSHLSATRFLLSLIAMAYVLHQIDAFTDTPFGGNPAAVCLLPAFPEDTWMQQVAGEMNLSETAFLVAHNAPTSEAPAYHLRWFTPTTEVDLCGHATLASAHWLYAGGTVAADATVTFHTASGVLEARYADEMIWLDFPAEPPHAVNPPDGLLEALGTPAAVTIARNRMDYLVQLETAAAVRALTPDLTRLSTIDTRGVIVTAPSDDSAYDVVSRFFAPRVGVPEDPVTGSAHCALAPYWHRVLGRDELTGYQASARGGVVRMQHTNDRVQLGGQAVAVLKATLLV